VRLTNRLRCLEQTLPTGPGSPACRHRKRFVTVNCQRQRDGSITTLEPEPPPCAGCGRVGEVVVRSVRPYHEGVTGEQVVGPGPK
jgi:hypothetical protein